MRAARLEGGKIKLIPRSVNIATTVKETIKRNSDFAQACNCQISLNIAKNLPKAYIDPLQIKPIIEGGEAK